MRKKVLVIEDEKDMREALKDTLESADFSVVTTDNGDTGLRLAIAEHPDLIMLDVLMPVMGGQEMLEKLRQDPWGKDAKVIMITAVDDMENVGKGFEKEIDDYIIKGNMSLSDILKVVREVISKEE